MISGGFVLRLFARLAFGESYFWQNGYSSYHEMALNFLNGGGLCIDRLGLKCAYWPPVCPLFVAGAARISDSYLAIVIPQALFGAGTVACAFLLGKMLFGQATGLIASLMAAVYPYYVVHDTALQERVCSRS